MTVAYDTARVQRLEVAAFEIPTDEPESDGTLSWDSTTIVVVEARAGGETGLGYTYGHRAIADIVAGELADAVEGLDALAAPLAWSAMTRTVRNSVRAGLCAYAGSAVDIALHDLKARLLGGRHRAARPQGPPARREPRRSARAPARGHRGLRLGRLHVLLTRPPARAGRGWRDAGIDRVKVKVGRDPAADGERLHAVRDVVGDDVRLMVDADGAFTPQAAIAAADDTYAPAGVTWLEEPVSSGDHDGLGRVRDHAPPAWRSRPASMGPASMGPTSSTSDACSAPSTSSNPT